MLGCRSSDPFLLSGFLVTPLCDGLTYYNKQIGGVAPENPSKVKCK